MATKKSPDPVTEPQALAPVSGSPLVTERSVDEVALQLFASMVAARDVSQLKMTVLAAHRAARVFLRTTAEIQAGTLSLAEPQDVPPERVKVLRMRTKKGDEVSRPVQFEPVRDGAGVPIMLETYVDCGAFAPNCDASHPVNQRFRSPDGRPLEQLLSEARSGLRPGGWRSDIGVALCAGVPRTDESE